MNDSTPLQSIIWVRSRFYVKPVAWSSKAMPIAGDIIARFIKGSVLIVPFVEMNFPTRRQFDDIF